MLSQSSCIFALYITYGQSLFKGYCTLVGRCKPVIEYILSTLALQKKGGE